MKVRWLDNWSYGVAHPHRQVGGAKLTRQGTVSKGPNLCLGTLAENGIDYPSVLVLTFPSKKPPPKSDPLEFSPSSLIIYYLTY